MENLYSFPEAFKMVYCRYGRMLYPAKDLYVGKSLGLYGEFSEGEAAVFKALAGPGDVIVDIGANIGAHTVLFARIAGGGGAVLAFEPQPMLFQALNANLALNNIFNVKTERCGLGARGQVLYLPNLDYGDVHNFGGVSLDLVDEGIPVQVRSLDSCRVPKCALIKIDVEGMEQQVLEGAANTIHDLRPALYVENDRQEKSPDLIHLLLDMGYSLWWHVTPLFNPGNFAGNHVNEFGKTVSVNMLCLPAERPGAGATPLTAGMTAVRGPDDWWQ